MPELLLALDVGTTTARALVFEADGVVIGLGRASLRSHAPRPGLVEQDAGKVWLAARGVIADALRRAHRAPGDVAAIGVTTQRTSIVVWDRKSGKPLAPMVVWSDLRGGIRAQELLKAGFVLGPQQAATKLESVIADVSARGSDIAWGNIDSYLIWRLTGGGAHVTDRSQAWPTGYLDLGTMQWNERLISHQGFDLRMFPTLADTWGPIAVTSPKVFGAAVQIAADVADQQSALIAHGETAKVTYGTSASLDVATGADLVFKSPTTPPFVLFSSGGETRFCVEGMVLSAGSALDWLRGACGLGGCIQFERLARSVEDTAGAAFLPSLQGLGAPYGDPARRGALVGLSASVSQAHIARAGLEGVAFRTREVFDSVFELTGRAPPEVIGVDGGLTANETFLQIQADLLGRPVRRHAVHEATAAGAALAAARGVGLVSVTDTGPIFRYDRTIEPHISADEAESRFVAWRAQVYP